MVAFISGLTAPSTPGHLMGHARGMFLAYSLKATNVQMKFWSLIFHVIILVCGTQQLSPVVRVQHRTKSKPLERLGERLLNPLLRSEQRCSKFSRSAVLSIRLWYLTLFYMFVLSKFSRSAVLSCTPPSCRTPVPLASPRPRSPSSPSILMTHFHKF